MVKFSKYIIMLFMNPNFIIPSHYAQIQFEFMILYVCPQNMIDNSTNSKLEINGLKLK